MMPEFVRNMFMTDVAVCRSHGARLVLRMILPGAIVSVIIRRAVPNAFMTDLTDTVIWRYVHDKGPEHCLREVATRGVDRVPYVDEIWGSYALGSVLAAIVTDRAVIYMVILSMNNSP